MKWKNKGHEFDEYAKKLALSQSRARKYYIFGAGIIGKRMASILQWYGCAECFIDNDISKQGSKTDGISVVSLESYLQIRDGQIIVAVSSEKEPEIVEQLEKNSLIHEMDFWLHEEFINIILPIISTYYYDKVFIPLAQISLTERCSLKCKKCAHGCYAVDHNAEDLTLEQVYKSTDSFFAKVDYIKEFVLIGGEPCLYKDLSQVISYIGKRYRDRIKIFSITTNGTIVPNKEVLIASREYNVLFRISNYIHQIPRLEAIHKCLVDMLKAYNIQYILQEKETEWIDYGFEYVNREATEEELIRVFDACHTPCREVRENRFYYCVMARSISDNLKYHVGQNDYLDLEQLNGENYKKELLEFILGYSEKGYLDMCRHCRGAEAKDYPILAAEQVLK